MVWWTSINRYHSFLALAKRRFFPRFSSTRRNMPCLYFCNIFPQDLIPLHVKVTRGTNLSRVCRRKLKLWTYLRTVSYNHASFFNTRSQLFRVLGTAGSSGFYSKTRRTISGNSFSKTASIQRKLFSLVGVISFISLSFYSMANRPRLPCFHTIK